MVDDRRARFEAVYMDTYEQILGYATRRCDSPEDAADAVAETYTIAWRKIDKLPAGDEARLWLYAVARKVLANHRRGEQRRRARNLPLHEELAQVYGTVPSPEDRPDLRAVGQAFRTLSDRDRELLSLVLWEDLDHGEIARVLGCSRGAVHVRLHRARKRLARTLADAGVEVPQGRSGVTAPLTEGRSL